LSEKALIRLGIAVFPDHSLDGDHPLLAVFAGVDAVNKFAVGNSLAKGALVESPKFRFETLLFKRQNNGLLFGA